MKYIYGPVASRRLGFSLGIDIIPYKTCSFDCIYCQLGGTTNKTIERKEYLPKEEILIDVKQAISSGKKIDYVTFSGSGEPTLYSEIGWLIKEISKIKYQKSKIPIAVLTNSSILCDKQVREDLLSADLVAPSLDAANDELLEEINRPHLSLNIEKIMSGLKEFRKVFKGKIWLEVMLVKSINDNLKHITLLKSKIREIEPDKVQLNTVVRPPAEDFAYPLSLGELGRIKNILGENCEIIAEFKKTAGNNSSHYIEEVSANILALLKRRPGNLSDISSSLGIHRNELIKYLETLERDGRIKRVNYDRLNYYEYK